LGVLRCAQDDNLKAGRTQYGAALLIFLEVRVKALARSGVSVYK